MMGTEPALNAADNVDVIRFMEEEVLRLARRKSFDGIFTTNTSPLTQVQKYLSILNTFGTRWRQG